MEDASRGAPLTVRSPSAGDVVAAGRYAGANQIRDAVGAATRAFERVPADHGLRACLAHPPHREDVLLSRADAIALDLAVEHGKTLAEARAEVRTAAEMFHEAGEDANG